MGTRLDWQHEPPPGRVLCEDSKWDLLPSLPYNVQRPLISDYEAASLESLFLPRIHNVTRGPLLPGSFLPPSLIVYLPSAQSLLKSTPAFLSRPSQSSRIQAQTLKSNWQTQSSLGDLVTPCFLVWDWQHLAGLSERQACWEEAYGWVSTHCGERNKKSFYVAKTWQLFFQAPLPLTHVAAIFVVVFFRDRVSL